MANTITLKKSGVAGRVPTTGTLSLGEIALNYKDGYLFYRDDELSPAVHKINADNADTVDGFHLNQDVRSTASPSFAGLTTNLSSEGTYFTGGSGGLRQLSITSGTNTSAHALHTFNIASSNGKYEFDVDGTTELSLDSSSATFAGAVTIANLSVSQTAPTTQLLFDNNNIDNGGGYNIDFKSSSNDTANRFMARIQALRGSGAISSLGFFTETGSALTRALLLDSSQNATFAGNIHLDNDSSQLQFGDDNDMQIYHNGANGEINNSTGGFTIDSAADITLDAGGQDIILSDDGTIFGTLSNSSGLQIRSRVNNADMYLRGVDGGTEFTALRLDMSAGGVATFSSNVIVNGGQILTPSGTNLALNPNTGIVSVGGVIQCSGTGASTFAGSVTATDGTFTGDLTVNGKTILGNALTDKAIVHGHLGIGDDTYPKIAYPGQNALWGVSSNPTGQVVIDLPGTLANYDMSYIEIDIYEYNSTNATKLIIGGHNWNSGANSNTSATMWHNAGVTVIGNNPKSVYLGWRNDGTNNRRVIAIGETNSSWNYPTIHVAKVHGNEGYSTAIDWVGDWAMNLTTSSSFFTKSPTTNFNASSSTTLRTHGKISAAGGTFSGDVTAPTQSSGENSTKIATTAYVKSQGYLTSLGNALLKTGGTMTGQLICPSASTTRPVLTGGFISRNDNSDGDHDVHGLSERYYPSNSTTADAWGLQWNGTNNQYRFIGGGSVRLSIDLDGGNTDLKWNNNSIFHDAYHPNADTLTTTRNIALAGDVTGNVNFNGSANVSITTALAANSVGSSEIATDAVGASEIAASAVGASELNVSGNGTTAQFLRSDGDGTFTWATPTDNNTIYTHPTHAGDDINIDTGVLTGATVISDLDFNVTTDGLGHVTDANGTVATRTLTAANLGISAPNAPASASAAIVGNTVEVTFAASTTTGIDAYLVYSSIDGSDYGLISIVPPDDFAASMSIIDNAFDETGTQAYRVYAMKYGILSSATTASVSYTVSSAEPTSMSVVNLNNAYYVQWNPPSSNARFVTAYNVYKHEHATQGSLLRSSASLVYSGMNTNYMYQISGTNNNNFHQFWVETTIA